MLRKRKETEMSRHCTFLIYLKWRNRQNSLTVGKTRISWGRGQGMNYTEWGMRETSRVAELHILIWAVITRISMPQVIKLYAKGLPILLY